MWDYPFSTRNATSTPGGTPQFIRASPITATNTAVKATTKTITKHSMSSITSTQNSSGSFIMSKKDQPPPMLQHQPIFYPTAGINSIPRTLLATSKRQLSLTLWRSPTSNVGGASKIEAAQLGGSMGYCRFFVSTLPHRGGFWFKEPLQNIMGLNNNHGGIINSSLISDVPHRQWPQYFITRRSMMNTSNACSGFNMITNAIKNYVAGSTDDTAVENVKWNLTVKEKVLSSAEMNFMSNWDATDISIDNQRLLSRWGNTQTSAMLRRREQREMNILRINNKATNTNDASERNGVIAPSSSSVMFEQTPQQQLSAAALLLFNDQNGCPSQYHSQRQRAEFPRDGSAGTQYPSSRLRVPRFQSIAQKWDYEAPCERCGFVYLKSHTARDRILCCRKGAICYGARPDLFSTLAPISPIMMNLIKDDPKHYSHHSAVYNRMLSIGSTFIDNGRGNKTEQIQGNSSVTINGEVKYYIPRDIQNVRGGLHYFTYDGLDKVNAHADSVNNAQSEASRRLHGVKVKLPFLHELFTVLRQHHSFCEELKWIGEEAAKYDMLVTPAQANNIIDKAPFNATAAHEQVMKLVADIKQRNEFLEVAAFSADNIQENRTYYVKLKGKSRFIEMWDREVEGLLYPLFYTHNEHGYNHNKRKELPINQYIISRIFQPEPNWIFPFNTASSKLQSCTNRFQLFSRLMQYYIVEWYSRAIDYRLRYHRKINKKIVGHDTRFFDETIDVAGIPGHEGDERDEYSDNEDDRRSAARRLSMPINDDDSSGGDEARSQHHQSNTNANNHGGDEVVDAERLDLSSTSKSFLADSITGSPRHLKACALNALAVVSQLGPPTFFITLTCNPNWPELKERLPEGQTAFDRPDVTVLVFRARLKAFLHNLRHGKYFGGGKKVYIMNVVEYQHRGLPHAHIIFKVDNCGDSDEEKLAFIDQHVAAYFPSSTPENEVYCSLIRQHMIHNCSSACKKDDGRCKRGYMDRVVTSETSFDAKGYPLYKRPTEDDLKVVPHNRQILIDWDGHSNTEFCGRTYAVMYLYKYLYKGNAKVSLKLNNTDDVDKEDEIKLFQRGRMISAMQAIWCLIGYQTFPSSDPAVIFIKSKLPLMVKQINDDGKVCDLTIYFNRPYEEPFLNLTYTQFFANWDYKGDGKAPKYAKQGGVGVLYSIDIRGIAGLKIDVYKRKEPKICRMGKVPFTSGEAFYLRLLLNEVPAYGFQQLKRYWKHGQQFDAETFQEAAIGRGLVEKVETARVMFNEELLGSSPYEFRMFFVHATLHGFPTLEFFNQEEIWQRMCQDYYLQRNNWHLARNDLLKELARLFKSQSEGKKMQDFGLPEWTSTDTELDMERVKYPKESQRLLAESLLQQCPLTEEMEQLFQILQASLHESNSTYLALLQGRAGSGKSTFAKYLAAYCRSLGHICLGCASTGLAATVYEDFSTAHALFAIPVVEDAEEYDQEQDIQCKLDLPSYAERRKLLDATKLIIWDEVSSQHMKDINAVYRAMDSFKNKIVLFIGDALQITPVVQHGSKEEICSASIYCGGRASIHNLNVFKFTKNLRLQRGDQDADQVAYIKLLDQISTNNYQDIDDADPNAKIDVFQDDADNDDADIKVSGRKIIAFAPKQLKYLQSEKEVVEFAFPNGFTNNTMHKSCILATKNEQVEEWNSKVQELNPNPPHTLSSLDSLDLVDDPFGFIQRMITEELMNDTNDPGNCPPHQLTLKVGDICLLMRAVNKEEKFATNSRVRIDNIKRHSVRIQSLSEPNKFFTLPRFVFNIKLSIGKGYCMTRHQFPLRLAYSMSINKSQGQQYERCPVDLRSHCFSHGHLNVAMSRITDPANIALFVTPTDYEDSEHRILTSNVVYKEILTAVI